MSEKPSDSTKDPEFQRVLRNMLSMPHKPHTELKPGKTKAKGGKPGGKPPKAKARA